jgi:hypothetical protein
MTVTTVVLTEMSSTRASSAVPWKAIRSHVDPGGTAIWDSPKPATIAASDAAAGMTHNAPSAYSFSAYQLTDRRTFRAKPSVRGLGLMVRIRLSPGEADQP